MTLYIKSQTNALKSICEALDISTDKYLRRIGEAFLEKQILYITPVSVGTDIVTDLIKNLIDLLVFESMSYRRKV